MCRVTPVENHWSILGTRKSTCVIATHWILIKLTSDFNYNYNNDYYYFHDTLLYAQTGKKLVISLSLSLSHTHTLSPSISLLLTHSLSLSLFHISVSRPVIEKQILRGLTSTNQTCVCESERNQLLQWHLFRNPLASIKSQRHSEIFAFELLRIDRCKFIKHLFCAAFLYLQFAFVIVFGYWI